MPTAGKTRRWTSPSRRWTDKQIVVFAARAQPSWSARAKPCSEAGASCTVVEPASAADGTQTAETTSLSPTCASTSSTTTNSWSVCKTPIASFTPGVSIPRHPATDQLAVAIDRACTGTLLLVQALAKSSAAQKPSVYLVTQQAQLVDEAADHINPLQAPLWGMGRVAAMEVPELTCRLVDLGDAATTPRRWSRKSPPAATRTNWRCAASDGSCCVWRPPKSTWVPGPGKGKLRIPTERPFKLSFTDCRQFRRAALRQLSTAAGWRRQLCAAGSQSRRVELSAMC